MFSEVLAQGKPVVLNDGGWQREISEPAGAGLGCHQGDTAEFCAQLSRLKSDPQLRETMGRNARKLAVKQFSRDRLAAGRGACAGGPGAGKRASPTLAVMPGPPSAFMSSMAARTREANSVAAGRSAPGRRMAISSPP